MRRPFQLWDIFGLLPCVKPLVASAPWHPPFFRPTAGPGTGPGSGGGRVIRDQRPLGPVNGPS